MSASAIRRELSIFSGSAAGGKTWPQRMKDRQIPVPPPTHGSPGWIEITVYIHLAAQDALAAFFFDHGVSGVLTEDAPP